MIVIKVFVLGEELKKLFPAVGQTVWGCPQVRGWPAYSYLLLLLHSVRPNKTSPRIPFHAPEIGFGRERERRCLCIQRKLIWIEIFFSKQKVSSNCCRKKRKQQEARTPLSQFDFLRWCVFADDRSGSGFLCCLKLIEYVWERQSKVCLFVCACVCVIHRWGRRLIMCLLDQKRFQSFTLPTTSLNWLSFSLIHFLALESSSSSALV